jgi:hypothetical protein
MSEALPLLDELCALETLRQTRILSKAERARWLDLQKQLTRELCNFSTGSGEERRATLRVPCPLEVKVESSHATFLGTAIDVSSGGIGVHAGLLPAAGEQVTLLWAEEPKGKHFQLDLPGHVVWLRKINHALGAGFGVAFDPTNAEQDQRLAQLLLFLLRKERQRLQLPPLNPT